MNNIAGALYRVIKITIALSCTIFELFDVE